MLQDLSGDRFYTTSNLASLIANGKNVFHDCSLANIKVLLRDSSFYFFPALSRRNFFQILLCSFITKCNQVLQIIDQQH